MAVITFDKDNNIITILVEKTDRICDKEAGIITIDSGKNYTAGKMFTCGEEKVYMMRGERE